MIPIGGLLLLGASGDLAGRLLLPALGQFLDGEESRRRSCSWARVPRTGTRAWQDRVRSSFAVARFPRRPESGAGDDPVRPRPT